MGQHANLINCTGMQKLPKFRILKDFGRGIDRRGKISYSKFADGAKFNVCCLVTHATEKTQSVLKTLLRIDHQKYRNLPISRVHSLNYPLPETASHNEGAARSLQQALARGTRQTSVLQRSVTSEGDR
jgi:hypothetical protein